MRPQEVTDFLRCGGMNCDGSCERYPNTIGDCMTGRVHDYVIQLEQRVPRWISVEERLPENYISVIGYLPFDNNEGLPPTREVYLTEKGWFAPSLGELCIVTHWMSMPEGFREG